MEGVPVIDLGLDRPTDARHRAEAARAIGAACETGGYFVAAGHGIAPEMIEAVYAASARFFAEAEPVKTALTADRRDPVQRGYSGGAMEKYSASRLGEQRPAGLPPITEDVLRIETSGRRCPGSASRSSPCTRVWRAWHGR
jgi:isopenicillin N synthase-like dioxygenase